MVKSGLVAVWMSQVWISYGLDQSSLGLLWFGLVKSRLVEVWISWVWVGYSLD